MFKQGWNDKELLLSPVIHPVRWGSLDTRPRGKELWFRIQVCNWETLLWPPNYFPVSFGAFPKKQERGIKRKKDQEAKNVLCG